MEAISSTNMNTPPQNIHPILGKAFLAVALLLLLVVNGLHARYLGEVREEKKKVVWSYVEPSET